MYVPWKQFIEKRKQVIVFVGSYQNLHWKLGQQTPSAGTLLAYLETTA